MDRSIRFRLLTVNSTQDEIGQWIEELTPRCVYGRLESVSASEFFAAGQTGFRPDFRIVMFGPDYNGERDCIVNDVQYSIYRTYYRKNDMVELYLERRAGDEGND